MWGTSQRDDKTIPAEASRRLQALAGPSRRIEVTNFGENGYVLTQEVIELMLQLRKGNVPDIVVFFDGINDAGATVQWGEGGNTQNESKRVAEFTGAASWIAPVPTAASAETCAHWACSP